MRLHDGDYNIMMLLRVHTDETLQFAVGYRCARTTKQTNRIGRFGVGARPNGRTVARPAGAAGPTSPPQLGSLSRLIFRCIHFCAQRSYPLDVIKQHAPITADLLRAAIAGPPRALPGCACACTLAGSDPPWRFDLAKMGRDRGGLPVQRQSRLTISSRPLSPR